MKGAPVAASRFEAQRRGEALSTERPPASAAFARTAAQLSFLLTHLHHHPRSQSSELSSTTVSLPSSCCCSDGHDNRQRTSDPRSDLRLALTSPPAIRPAPHSSARTSASDSACGGCVSHVRGSGAERDLCSILSRRLARQKEHTSLTECSPVTAALTYATRTSLLSNDIAGTCAAHRFSASVFVKLRAKHDSQINGKLTGEAVDSFDGNENGFNVTMLHSFSLPLSLVCLLREYPFRGHLF